MEYYTAMRCSGGRVCALFDDRRAVSVVRYRPSGWERCDRPRTRGRGVVVPMDRADVLAALRRSRPVLVARDEVRHLFAAARHPTDTPLGTAAPATDPAAAGPACDRTGRRFRDWRAIRGADGADPNDGRRPRREGRP